MIICTIEFDAGVVYSGYMTVLAPSRPVTTSTVGSGGIETSTPTSSSVPEFGQPTLTGIELGARRPGMSVLPEKPQGILARIYARIIATAQNARVLLRRNAEFKVRKPPVAETSTPTSMSTVLAPAEFTSTSTRAPSAEPGVVTQITSDAQVNVAATVPAETMDAASVSADGDADAAPAALDSAAATVTSEAASPSQYIETPEQTAVIDPLFQEAARLSLDAGNLEGVLFASVGQHITGATAIGAEARREYLSKIARLSARRGVGKNNRARFDDLQIRANQIIEAMPPRPIKGPGMRFLEAHEADITSILPEGTTFKAITAAIQGGRMGMIELANMFQGDNAEFSRQLTQEFVGPDGRLPEIDIKSNAQVAVAAGLTNNYFNRLKVARARGEYQVTPELFKKTGIYLLFAVFVYNMFEGEASAQRH